MSTPYLKLSMAASTVFVGVLALALVTTDGALPRDDDQADSPPGARAAARDSARREAPRTSADDRVPEHVGFAALLALAERDPAGAVNAAVALGDPQLRAQALHESLPLWLAADSEAARSWLLEHVQTSPLELALQLAADAAAFDPSLGFDVVRQIPGAAARAPGILAVFSHWAAREPARAAAAAETLLKGEGRAAAVSEVARLWAEQDPRGSLAWARTLADPDARRSALEPVMRSWAEHDPVAAAAAVATLPPDVGRVRLVDSVATQWTQQDPKGALAWTAKLPDPGERAAAATTVLTALVERDPELAASWALVLSEPTPQPVLEKFLAAWLARDLVSAQSWARAHGLSSAPGAPLGTALTGAH